MASFARHLGGYHVGVVLLGSALWLSACSSNVTAVTGSGGSGGSGANNTGANNTGANNTGANNTGANNTGANNTGGSVPVDCVTAQNLDPCTSPGSYCSYYDAATNEYCDAYCDESYHWQKYCYTEPTYCYNPTLCPNVMPTNGAACQTTTECEYYDCEYFGTCGGSGYGVASCQGGIWYTYEDCYCFQPPDLCPTMPPQDLSPCSTTQQCQTYDCEWYDACGMNTYHYAYCDGGVWFSSGNCL